MALPHYTPRMFRWHCLVCWHEWSAWETQSRCPKCERDDKQRMDKMTANLVPRRQG